MDRPMPQSGEEYRHFISRRSYIVISVGRNTETGEDMVVCTAKECGDSIWIRPIKGFMAKVDTVNEYPNVTQEYRFVKVE